MTLLPPCLILFDITALLPGKTGDWQDYSRLGDCFVPEGVLEELRSLGDQAPEPTIESAAREFNRFYPTSGWKKTDAIAEHPSLKPTEGHTLSKRARLALEVLQCAYGLAGRRSDSLVILVCNDQPMLQRLTNLNTPNLCGIPLTALVQWSRTQRRPPVVSQHLQLLRSTAGVSSNVVASSKSAAALPVRSTVSRPASPTASRTSPRPPYRPQRPTRSFRLTELVSNLMIVLIAAIALAGMWRIVSPASFNQFWQQLPGVGGR